MANEKVFGSDITRTHNNLNNNLYDLLTVFPVKPLQIDGTKFISCDFVPKTEKHFIPKKYPRLKVKTVRDIRNMFEKDISSDLYVDIEKQQNLLLRKIRGGSSRDERTKLFAKSLLKSEKPISRTTWQMVINVNPDNCTHPSQYVLWNGKCIQLSGSRGGKSKFIYKYDLADRRTSLLQRNKLKKGNLNMKRNLLKHSLNVTFKPGPLSKKIHLDDSYQKYNIGNTKLAHLPKPGLEILTEYGKPLESSVANFLHNLRDESGIISDKWAEFAISALGSNKDGRAVPLNKDKYITFDLNYKYDQRWLLMRNDSDEQIIGQVKKQTLQNLFTENEEAAKHEIKKMLDEMLDSVEISLTDVYTEEDPPREPEAVNIKDSSVNIKDSQPKDKIKRKGQSELHRLDVTVIRVCDSQEKTENDACQKSFCTLGCICDSLMSSYRLKNHCGHIECMFECRCDFNKYNINRSLEDSIIPGLVNLDIENSSKLSKEEQKFHQTVILSGEKSIMLKSQRRNWKAPEKYADFYSNMCLKTKEHIKRTLSVVEVKLNCENIEPWCMIHNLYKCFCKGKFTEKLSDNVSIEETKLINNELSDTKFSSVEKQDTNVKSNTNHTTTTNTLLRPRIPHVADTEIKKSQTINGETNLLSYNSYRCARVKPYRKRKYGDAFYFNANKKIMELEQNDIGLHKRLLEILKLDENIGVKKPDSAPDLPPTPVSVAKSTTKVVLDEPQNNLSNDSSPQKMCGDVIATEFTSESPLNKKLKAWLEPSLKMYRQRFSKGFFKKSLEPPKAGKISLYPWDFIIERYHEKKNLFLVSNQKPFRIFMAVDHRNPLFKNCIDITNIEDLDKYPLSIKNIVTQEADRLKDQLCILRGLSFCWELVGSVKKVRNSGSENDTDELDVDTQSPQKVFSNDALPVSSVNDPSLVISLENIKEQSKWFVMTVENDFTEIQFYNRGFFVKYESIIKAINVARVSNKTVRLSSQKCGDGSTDPQFGIYAVPIANECCVLIGPYEKNQPLGIETVKTSITNQQSKTRGVWITTNKVDNLRVIDDPLLFMAQVNLEHGQILDESLQDETSLDSVCITDVKSVGKEIENNKVVKLVKPIKITKTNNFYHLTPSGILKPISMSPEKPTSRPPIIIKKRNEGMHIDLEKSSTTSLMFKSLPLSDQQKQHSCKRPIAEIAPQVKVVNDCRESNNTQQKTSGRKFEGGMFVLKPEEINSRLNNICINPPPFEDPMSTSTLVCNEIDMDIENFLANSVECTAPNNDVYVISDDEDYCNIEPSNRNSWKDVFITCASVKKIGWISGRQNENGHLSFEFPGFKFTEFYPEHEAFAKITQVLARKVYIPDHVNLRWTVVKTKNQLYGLQKLNLQDLNPDLVLTKKGLIHKCIIAQHVSKNIKTYSRKASRKKESTESPKEIEKEEADVEFDLTETGMEAMDIKSNALLEEGEQLMSETILKKGELTDTLSNMTNDRRQKISDRLRSIIANYS